MARKLIVVEDFDGDTERFEKALKTLQDQGFNAYFSSSVFGLAHQTETTSDAPVEPSAPANETALRTLLNQKIMLEDELRKYRTLLENSGDLMYAYDLGGIITYVTPNIREFLGYEPDEVLGRSFVEFVAADYRAMALEQFKLISLNGNRPYSFRISLMHRDGRRIPIEISSRTFYEDGFPVMHVGLARDITERRRMEVEMKKRNRELSALYSVASVLNQSLELETLLQTCLERMMEALEVETGGMFLLGPQGEFRQWASRGMDERFRGIIATLRSDQPSLERVMHNGEVWIVDDLETLPNFSNKLVTELGYRSVAVGPLRAKDRILGAFFLARKVAHSFSEADRSLIASVGGQVGMALEIGGLYRELNTTVNEVRKANARLEEATRHKSEFLANMSHELRTPLNAIIGFSEILQDQAFGPLNEKQSRYATNILTGGKNLLALVNDVLDLSKVEAGKMELLVEKFNPLDVINDVLGQISIMAQKKQIGLSLRPGDVVSFVKADRRKFKQILYNLLSNAVKFTPDGGTVEVQIRRVGATVELSVIDNGIGINPQDHERIFEEFRMLDNVLTKKQQGTGLGLALSRRLAQLHGGTVRVQSELGRGSTFTLSLPLEPQVEPIPFRPAPNLAEPSSHNGNGSGMEDYFLKPSDSVRGREPKPGEKWALVVEDDDKAAELLQVYLEQSGYRVSRTNTGDSALAQAKVLKPAVISLDVVLPTKNGWEVLRELKNDPDTRDIPVMVVSMLDNRKISFELGAVACFVKPVRRDELASKLAELQLHELRKRRRKHMEEHVQYGEPLRALVIDDNPNDRELITTTLSAVGLTVATAPDGEIGWQMAQRNPPDLVVLDLMMPKLNGFEVLTRLRQNLATLDVPVFVYTAKELDSQEHRRLGHDAEIVLQKGDLSRQTLIEAVNRLTMNNEQ